MNKKIEKIFEIFVIVFIGFLISLKIAYAIDKDYEYLAEAKVI